jgi:penicillin-binding protein 1B
VAAKTGTTDGERDLWFVGYTPELVSVVWLGFDKPRSVGSPSSVAALPIWVEFMREAVGAEVRGSFLPPSTIARIEIEPTTGARAYPGCGRQRSEFFLQGTEPEESCPAGAGRRRGRSIFDWLRRLM